MKAMIFLLLLVKSSSAYVATSIKNRPMTYLNERINDDSMLDGSDSMISHDDESDASLTHSLSERIAQVEQNESSFVSGLQRRVKSIVKAEEFDSAIGNGDENFRGPIIVELPVVCLDALLPNQSLTGSTTDPTFCNLLRSIGLGGTFVMTSLNARARKLRRFGVLVRIEIVDVDSDDDFEKNRSTGDQYGHLSNPTAVTFSIAGKRRCEILGPPKGMKHRIGRWRRVYDPQGEESRLGWGEESFVDSPGEYLMVDVENESASIVSNCDDTIWSNSRVSIIDEVSEDAEATSDAVAAATYLIPLIERWISLASDQTTYDNVDVVARTRCKAGEPGLSVNASALIRKVKTSLGPMPSPTRPTAFAVWGAALINPLPPLGVAPEIRGAALEANGAERKLAVLQRGLIKSLNNLDGTKPLNM
jgi:hypothetical protein